MATTLRRSDGEAEVAVGKFLDRYFYPAHVTNLVRYHAIAQQMAGIDVKFDHANVANMLVDEKAAVHYVNKDIPTFAFEVDFLLSSGQLVEGWFYDPNKLTQYYLLIWIWATKEKAFLVDDITKLDILIIDRRTIVQMLSKQGLASTDASNISKEIRRNGDPGVHYKASDKPYYFYYSTQLAEKPINIIIKKNALVDLAMGRYIINK